LADITPGYLQLRPVVYAIPIWAGGCLV